LTEVLDHLLRVGDSEISENILAAYKERGLQPPEHLVDPPDIRPEFLLYWIAWKDLQTERPGPKALIPVNAIFDYATRIGVDQDRLKRIVWEVDKTLLDYWRSQEENAKKQAELERASRPGIGAGS
jgi:hypothetical protein